MHLLPGGCAPHRTMHCCCDARTFSFIGVSIRDVPSFNAGRVGFRQLLFSGRIQQGNITPAEWLTEPAALKGGGQLI